MKTIRRFHSGSSLIEVVVAMAVVAFGLVAVLGVMPKAFDSAAASQHETRSFEIAGRLFAAMSSQPYTDIRFPSYGFNGARVTSRDRKINLETPANSSPPMKPWEQADGPSSGPNGPFKTNDGALVANYRGMIFDKDGGEWYLDKPTQDQTTMQSSSEKFEAYRIRISVDNDPAIPDIADPKISRRVTIRVAWRPFSQNFRDYVRIISK